MSARAKIGECDVFVQHGDITKEGTSAIVNSVGGGKSYCGGQCASAIEKAAGSSIRTEYEQNHKADSPDLVMTNGGDLEQSRIFHIVAKSSPQAMKSIVERTLILAEKEEMDSIAFPALGTGDLGGKPEVLASPIFEAIRDFSLNQSRLNFLRSIKIVIFKEEMFQEYKQAMYKTIPEYCGDEEEESPPFPAAQLDSEANLEAPPYPGADEDSDDILESPPYPII